MPRLELSSLSGGVSLISQMNTQHLRPPKARWRSPFLTVVRAGDKWEEGTHGGYGALGLRIHGGTVSGGQRVRSRYEWIVLRGESVQQWGWLFSFLDVTSSLGLQAKTINSLFHSPIFSLHAVPGAQCTSPSVPSVPLEVAYRTKSIHATLSFLF